MDSLVCKVCQQTSSVTPSTEFIRCHGCQRVISTGNIIDEAFSRRSKRLSLGLEIKKTEARNFYQNFRQKFSGSNPQQNQTERPLPSIVAADQPPRGKRALLCGVRYKKQKCELKGTAQDVKNIRKLLIQEYKFPSQSILILAEEESYNPPTRKNIEDAFQWLMRGIQPGDSLVFYFSGHGKRQRDLQGDEIDGFDETICPMDFENNGMILDNDINDAIVRPLIKDVTLHAIVDSCHSGTILDLPHVYDITTGKWLDNSPPSGAYKGTNGGKAICFSACEDYQLAADTSAFSSEMTGAMTTTFIDAIKEAKAKNKKITYQFILDHMHQKLKQAHQSGRLIAGIRRIFRRRILQDPLLSSSEEFSTSTEFKLY